MSGVSEAVERTRELQVTILDILKPALRTVRHKIGDADVPGDIFHTVLAAAIATKAISAEELTRDTHVTPPFAASWIAGTDMPNAAKRKQVIELLSARLEHAIRS